jgi:hypothetical protein
MTGLIPLLLFDRSQGYDNVNFSNYENLKPDVAATLVADKKQKQTPWIASPPPGGMPPQQQWGGPPPPSYGYQPPPAPVAFNPPPQRQQPPPVLGYNDVNGVLSTVNSNPELQRLVAQAQQKVQPPGYPPQPQLAINPQGDIANLLRSAQPQPPSQAYGQPQQSPVTPASGQNPYASLNALLSSVGGGSAPGSATAPAPPQQTQPQQSQAGQPDMTQLMAQLAQYSR